VLRHGSRASFGCSHRLGVDTGSHSAAKSQRAFEYDRECKFVHRARVANDDEECTLRAGFADVPIRCSHGMKLKDGEPQSATSSTVLDRETDEETNHDPSGPRIRCPLCGWSPRKEDRWSCNCGFQWNTFDTGGVCPACLHQWTETQCLSCRRWSAHSEWYAR